MRKIQIKRRWTNALFLSLPLFGLFMGTPARAAAPAADVDAVVARAAAAYMADPHAVGLSVGVVQVGLVHMPGDRLMCTTWRGKTGYF